MSGERPSEAEGGATGEARRVYAPGDVAGRLGVSGQRLRQLAAVYERVHGDLPRDRRGRVWPEDAVEELERAHAAVLEGRASSVERALRAPESAAAGEEVHPARSGGSRHETEALAAVVEELRLLRGAVEGMSRRMAGLERENRELQEAVRTGRELEAPADLSEPRGSDLSEPGPGPTDTPTGAPGGQEAANQPAHREAKPWWRRLLGR